jgi:hypothetical protein
MAGPLHTLHQIVDRWLAQVGQESERDAASTMAARLDRLFPERWQDLPPSPLSSSGSPIQLSVDTARRNELRVVIELSWLLADERHGIAMLAEHLPADQARMLTRVGDLLGARVPRLGLGLRLDDRDIAWKVYVGSDAPGDFIPWIRSFYRNGLLSDERDRTSLGLCAHIAKSAVMRGCSLTGDARGALFVSGIYYRSLLPYRRMTLIELLRRANVAQAAPTAVSVADGLGFADGTGKGCFGYMIAISPNGGVDNLKVEFSRIPWRNGHDLSLESLRQLDVKGLASAEVLGQAITAICNCKDAVAPEVVSWRGDADGRASIVTYFPLPRGDRSL